MVEVDAWHKSPHIYHNYVSPSKLETFRPCRFFAGLLLSILPSILLRSLPDAVKFDLPEGEGNCMKLKDLIFHSHRKNKVCFKKSSISVELKDSTLYEKTSTFLEKSRNYPPLFPNKVEFFKVPLTSNTDLKSFNVHNCSSYKDTGALGFILLNQKSYSLQIHIKGPD